jgi:hypothetical protein
VPHRRSSLLVLLVALATSGLAACSEGEEIAVGDVAATTAVSEPLDGRTLSVAVPTGELEVVLAGPTDEVGDQHAADDGRLLRLSTTFHDAAVRSDVWAFAGRDGEAEPVTLALDVDDERYDVGVVRRGAAGGGDVAPRDAVLAVPEGVDLDDVTVVVGYDGLDQAVSAADGTRQPGPADALYDEQQRGRSTDCAGGQFDPRLDPQLRCRTGEARVLPYLPDLGWAEPGRAWLVVSLGTELGPVRAGGAGYAVADVRNETTYEGQPPVRIYDERTGAGTYSAQLAFDVPADADGQGALQVRLEYRLALAAGDAPADGGADRLQYGNRVVVPPATPATD